MTYIRHVAVWTTLSREICGFFPLFFLSFPTRPMSRITAFSHLPTGAPAELLGYGRNDLVGHLPERLGPVNTTWVSGRSSGPQVEETLSSNRLEDETVALRVTPFYDGPRATGVIHRHQHVDDAAGICDQSTDIKRGQNYRLLQKSSKKIMMFGIDDVRGRIMMHTMAAAFVSPKKGHD